MSGPGPAAASWVPVAFCEIRVGDTVRTLDAATGEVIAQGVVGYLVGLKDHDRAVSPEAGLLARSDYPSIERRQRT